MTGEKDAHVRDLIARQSTLTLATTSKEGPWAAPVYYVSYKKDFYFFSSPQSRHIRDALSAGMASAAIHEPSDQWRDIRGIQMSGMIEAVFPGVRALAAYLKKYPFTRDFFKPGDAMDLADFARRMHVSFYRFLPHRIVYMDNRIRFGFREEICL